MSKQIKNKYKIVNRRGRKHIVIKSQKGQNLNLREVEDIQNGVMNYVLPMDVKVKDKNFVLSYEITNYIPLSQYIQALVNKKRYAEMVLQMLAVFRTMTESFYNPQGLVLELDKVMINPHMDKVLFVFVPILYYNCGITMKDFLIQLTYHTTFDSREDTSYVDHALEILQKNMNFSIVELEEYLQSIVTELSAGKHRNKIQSSSLKREYNPDMNIKREETVSAEQYNEIKPASEGTQKSSLGSRMTESLSDVQNADTTLLGEDSQAYLKQIKSGKIYYLDKSENRIGKRQCEVHITDNVAISKLHAIIYKMNGEIFIEDMNSTNGTKVNGQKIIAGNRVLLKDEYNIELADEKFIFYR